MSKALDHLKRSSADTNMRISKPTFHPEKFREAILYILDKTGGLSAINLTRILYFIDFDYYEVVEEHLMGAIYRKDMAWDVFTTKLKPALKELLKQGAIEARGMKYSSLKKPELSIFSKDEKFMIEEVTDHYTTGSSKDPTQIDIPIMATPPNCIIKYEAAFYRTPVFCARERLYKKSKELKKKAQMKVSNRIKNNIKNF